MQVNAAKNGGPRKREVLRYNCTAHYYMWNMVYWYTMPSLEQNDKGRTQAGRRKINGDHGGRTIKQAPGSGFTQLCNVQTSDSELQS